jgi:hypothetical protein
MHEGRVAGELPAGASEQQVIALAAGQAPPPVAPDTGVGAGSDADAGARPEEGS